MAWHATLRLSCGVFVFCLSATQAQQERLARRAGEDAQRLPQHAKEDRQEQRLPVPGAARLPRPQGPLRGRDQEPDGPRYCVQADRHQIQVCTVGNLGLVCAVQTQPNPTHRNAMQYT